MSSRIIRSSDLEIEEPQAIQWRPHGQAAPAQQPAAKPRTGTTELQPADSGPVKRLCANAYQQGHAAGEASATQRAQARLDPALTSFRAMLARVEAATRKTLRAEAEGAAVALALEVARRVLHREIAADPEAILGLVKAAYQKCDARATQRLRVAPQDAETIRENHTRLNFPVGLEIVSDRNLARGSAIFETSRGDLDASVDTQLAEIERGLADVLKRRYP